MKSSTLLALTAGALVIRTVAAQGPQETSTILSATNILGMGLPDFVVLGTGMPFSVNIAYPTGNNILVTGTGATAAVTGPFNTITALDGGFAQAYDSGNTLYVSQATGNFAGEDIQLAFGDGAEVTAYLSSATVSAQLTQGGFTGQVQLASGYMIQTFPGINILPATASATVTVSGLQVTAYQNQFDSNWRGSGNQISLRPSEVFESNGLPLFLPHQPTIVLGGSGNSLSVSGVTTEENAVYPTPTDYAVGVTIGEGPGNTATFNNRVDATVTGSSNSALATGSYQPRVFVASGATLEVRALGLTASGAAGALILATAPALIDQTLQRKRDVIPTSDINTISVENQALAVVSGASIAATAGPLGVVLDLGDAYVSVKSGGLGIISPNVDPNGPTPTVNAGATASLAMFAKAVVQDGSAPIQTPPGSILKATRISPDQRLVQAVPDPSLAGRARRARRALDNDDRPLCSNNLTHCPISSSAFECIDTLSNLESCGGCWYSGEGKDCSTIEGVDAVECVNAACVVQSCADGYHLAANGDKCILDV